MSLVRPSSLALVLLLGVGLGGCRGEEPGAGGGGTSADQARRLESTIDATAKKTIATAEKALDGQVPKAAGGWTECNLPGTGHAAYEVSGSLVAPGGERAPQLDRLVSALDEAGVAVRDDRAKSQLVGERDDHTVRILYGPPEEQSSSVWNISVESACLDLGRDQARELTRRSRKDVRG